MGAEKFAYENEAAAMLAQQTKEFALLQAAATLFAAEFVLDTGQAVKHAYRLFEEIQKREAAPQLNITSAQEGN
jgi:hypothetical protein